MNLSEIINDDVYRCLLDLNLSNTGYRFFVKFTEDHPLCVEDMTTLEDEIVLTGINTSITAKTVVDACFDYLSAHGIRIQDYEG